MFTIKIGDNKTQKENGLIFIASEVLLIANAFPSLNLIHTIVFDFDGIFTNNKVLIHESGSESVVCDRSDGLALDILRAYQKIYGLNFNFFILSKESNPVMLPRAKKLKLQCKNAVSNKLQYLEKYFLESFPGLEKPFDGLVYLGNGLNDLPAMRKSSFCNCTFRLSSFSFKNCKYSFATKGRRRIY